MTDLSILFFDGSSVSFPAWLETVVGIAFNYEAKAGSITSLILPPYEYARIPRAGFVPATPDAPEQLAPNFVEVNAPLELALNAPNATVELFRQQQDAYRRQTDTRAFFLRKVYESLGESVQQQLRGPTNDIPFYSLTLRPLFEALRDKYGSLSTEDVEQLLGRLEAPVGEGQQLREVLDQHRKIHATLASTPGSAISELQKIKALRRTLTKNSNKFAPAFHMFDHANPVATNVTFSALEATLRSFRPDEHTAADLGTRATGVSPRRSHDGACRNAQTTSEHDQSHL